VRQTDTVARIGGDEFAIVCDDLERPEDALAVGNKIGALIDRPIELHGSRLRVSSSIGLAFGALPGDEPRTLLARADRAMYAAKAGDQRRLRRSRLVVAD
jgi:diguanylate cyclase (GGDEF)-like protein